MSIFQVIVLAPALSSPLAHATAAHPQDCPFERAQYVLRADKNVTANFTPTGNQTDQHLLLRIASRKTGRTYWFTIDEGNGYSDAHISSTDAPNADISKDRVKAAPETGNADLSFFTLSETLDVASESPRTGNPAPAYLFVPELGANLWYFGPYFLAKSDTSVREKLPRSLFELAACQ